MLELKVWTESAESVSQSVSQSVPVCHLWHILVGTKPRFSFSQEKEN